MENTCGKCEHLSFGGIGGLRVGCCGMTKGHDFVVPHQSELENGNRGDATVMHLTRIPTHCLRDDVVKSESPAPNKDWVKLIVPAGELS